MYTKEDERIGKPAGFATIEVIDKDGNRVAYDQLRIYDGLSMDVCDPTSGRQVKISFWETHQPHSNYPTVKENPVREPEKDDMYDLLNSIVE